MKIKILIPVYNDWESLSFLLEDINKNIKIIKKHHISVVVVNDGSNAEDGIFSYKDRILYEPPPSPKGLSKHEELKDAANRVLKRIMSHEVDIKNIKSFKIIHLKENVGHARAFAIGLKYIYGKEKFDYVIPMDGDGEDRPQELALFLNEIEENPEKVIVGKRFKRSEGIIFRICYFLHKLLTKMYIGNTVNFGNYVCIPRQYVDWLLSEKDLWCSFSGTVFRLFGSSYSIPSIRGERYRGPSKMSFFNLIKHSLGIFAANKSSMGEHIWIWAIIFACLIYPLTQPWLTYGIILTVLNLIFYFAAVRLAEKRSSRKELDNCLKYISSVKELK